MDTSPPAVFITGFNVNSAFFNTLPTSILEVGSKGWGISGIHSVDKRVKQHVILV